MNLKEERKQVFYLIKLYGVQCASNLDLQKEMLKGGYFQESEWKLLGKFIRESRVQKVAVKELHKQTWFCSSTEMNEISQRQSYQEQN
jgi:hypothetical protein